MSRLPTQQTPADHRPAAASRMSFASMSSGSTAVSQTPTTSDYAMEPCTSQSSSFMSRHTSSPTSGPGSPSSAAEHSFFGVLSQKIRGRSRSRSRSSMRRQRSKSPLPPQQISPDHSSPTTPRPSPQPRQPSTSSTGSGKRRSTSSQVKRQSTDSSQGSNPWYGRHSNSWLFNDFSVTEHVSDAYHKLRRRDT